jgi:hypothetical protein
MDDDEKDYPNRRANERVENKILQCISLADWQNDIDRTANDISISLRDTYRKGNGF